MPRAVVSGNRPGRVAVPKPQPNRSPPSHELARRPRKRRGEQLVTRGHPRAGDKPWRHGERGGGYLSPRLLRRPAARKPEPLVTRRTTAAWRAGAATCEGGSGEVESAVGEYSALAHRLRAAKSVRGGRRPVGNRAATTNRSVTTEWQRGADRVPGVAPEGGRQFLTGVVDRRHCLEPLSTPRWGNGTGCVAFCDPKGHGNHPHAHVLVALGSSPIHCLVRLTNGKTRATRCGVKRRNARPSGEPSSGRTPKVFLLREDAHGRVPERGGHPA